MDELCSLLRGSETKFVKFIKKRDHPAILSFLQYLSLISVRNRIGDVELAQKVLQAIKKGVYDPFIGTMTLTFGEVAESHVGMQKIGEMDDRGFSYEDLLKAQKYFNEQGCETLLLQLNEFLPERASDEQERKMLNQAKKSPGGQAWILVARNGVKCLIGDNKGENILTEMLMFKWDTQLYNERRKVVQNKLARYNLNFSDQEQIADFSKGMGTTVPWYEVPILADIRSRLADAFGEGARDLKCEGNMYYAPGKTGIGYHGDTERRRVIGLRLGRPMTIHYMWYYNDSPRGLNASLLLEEGDIYCMSEKTVGTDWRAAPKKQYTLRHAAGAPFYTTKTPKIQIRDTRPWKRNSKVGIGEIYYKPKKSQKNPNPDWINVSL